ncbi:TPA: DUF1931 domain-containing protein [archaeon]|nr:DUF1931 domain-containing protein [Candidatus Naiadarchaeales archaeon SRR2090153.bin461]
MALVIRSKVREAAKGSRVSGDFFDALDKRVAVMLKDAQARCKANGRATLRPEDI